MEQLQATADASALTARVLALLEANRPGAARQLLSAVRRLAPPSPVIAELAARVAAREGRPNRHWRNWTTPSRNSRITRACANAAPICASGRTTRWEHWRMRPRRSSSTAPIRRPRRCSASCSWNSADQQTRLPASTRPWRPTPTNPAYRQGLAAAQEAQRRRRCGAGHAHRRHRRCARDGWSCATPPSCSASAAATSPRRVPACRGSPRRRRGRRLLVRPDGPRPVQSRPPCGSRRRLCRGAQAGARRPVCPPPRGRRRHPAGRTACAGRICAGRVRRLCRSLRGASHVTRLPDSWPDPCRARAASGHRRRRMPRSRRSISAAAPALSRWRSPICRWRRWSASMCRRGCWQAAAESNSMPNCTKPT